jgi:hypothetical protein
MRLRPGLIVVTERLLRKLIGFAFLLQSGSLRLDLAGKRRVRIGLVA